LVGTPQGGTATTLATQAVTITVTAPQAPVETVDLGVTVSDGGASRIMAGEALAYTIAYTNSGTGAATGVTLRETVPAHTTFNAGASSAGWTCANGGAAGAECTLNLDTVGTGGTGTRIFAVQVANALAADVKQLT